MSIQPPAEDEDFADHVDRIMDEDKPLLDALDD